MKGKNGNETFTAIIPNYNEIPIGTLKPIIRQAGLSPDDFMKLFWTWSSGMPRFLRVIPWSCNIFTLYLFTYNERLFNLFWLKLIVAKKINHGGHRESLFFLCGFPNHQKIIKSLRCYWFYHPGIFRYVQWVYDIYHDLSLNRTLIKPFCILRSWCRNVLRSCAVASFFASVSPFSSGNVVWLTWH